MFMYTMHVYAMYSILYIYILGNCKQKESHASKYYIIRSCSDFSESSKRFHVSKWRTKRVEELNWQSRVLNLICKRTDVWIKHDIRNKGLLKIILEGAVSKGRHARNTNTAYIDRIMKQTCCQSHTTSNRLTQGSAAE